MKKFKRIFYTLYILVALLVAFFSIDGLIETERMLGWLNRRITPYTQVYLALTLFLIMSLMMLMELLLEHFQIRRLKNQVPDLEAEITRLKAKLYDSPPTRTKGLEDADD